MNGDYDAKVHPPKALPTLVMADMWREAEKALPDGWSGPYLAPYHGGGYWAHAHRKRGTPPDRAYTSTDSLLVAGAEGYGPSPVEALRALVNRLRNLAFG